MRKLKGVLLTLLLVSPFCSSAKFPGLLQRFQLGYSFVMNSGTLESKYPISDSKDTIITRDFNTSAAFGVTVGTYFPLKRLGEASKLVLGVDFMYNVMTWKESNTDGGVVGFNGVTAQMALPIGLDVKFGADALNVKSHRFCATLGLGAYPSYALTAIDNTPLTIDPVFSVAPYAKLEAGVFAGICMKLRLIAAFGKIGYMEYNDKDLKATTDFYGNTNFAVSLLVMPFSFTWKQEEWWNTY
jgi:hypothetical protein